MSNGDSTVEAPETSVSGAGNGGAPAGAPIPDVVSLAAKVESLLAELTAMKAHIESDADRAQELRLQAEKDQNVVEVAREEIEAAKRATEALKNEATTVNAAIAAIQASATAVINEINATKANVETSSAAVVAALPAAQEGVNQVAIFLGTVRAHSDSATKLVSDLAAKIPAIEETATHQKDHELKLALIKGQYVDLKARIEGLLPGATSAGLAAAFRQQRERFKVPMQLWAGLFIISILGLLVVAGIGSDKLLTEEAVSSPWSAAGLYFVRRLPFYLPLLWLAYYAGRQHMQAKRVEEDYAYKESISTAFEGYKNQMSNDALATASPSPLAVLCNNALAMLAQNPGRIYEGKQHDITPTTPIVELLKEVQSLVKEIKSSKAQETLGQVAGKAIDMVAGATPAP